MERYVPRDSAQDRKYEGQNDNEGSTARKASSDSYTENLHCQ